MIHLIKARQRQYKTTVAVGIALELVNNWGYAVSDIVSNIRLYHPVGWESKLKNSLMVYQPGILSRANPVAYQHGPELETYHYVNNNGMRVYVGAMVDRGLKHRIILIDEIDRVFSHRFWQRAEQTEALLGLWQDEKLFNQIIGTCHLGKSVDTLIRESVQKEIISEVGVKGDTVELTVLDALNQEIFFQTMDNVGLVQQLFDSWEPVT